MSVESGKNRFRWNKIKKEYYALGILLLASGLYLLLRTEGRLSYRLPTPPLLEEQEIQSLKIDGPELSFTLHREGSLWKIKEQGYQVKKSPVNTLITNLAHLEVLDLIEPSTEFKELYDIETTLTLMGEEGEIRSIQLGKAAAQSSRVYAILEGEEAIYTIKDASSQVYLEQDFDAWIDLKILDLSTQDMKKIKANYGEEERIYEWDEKESMWFQDGKISKDSEKIQEGLSQLVPLTARSIYEENPSEEVFLSLEINDSALLEFYEKTEEGYPLRSRGRQAIFLVEARLVEAILIFFDPPSEQ